MKCFFKTTGPDHIKMRFDCVSEHLFLKDNAGEPACFGSLIRVSSAFMYIP